MSADFLLLSLLAVTIFLISLLKTDFALIILIFSMLLSPELEVGGIAGRAVIIRAEDIFLIVVFLGWLAKIAMNKELGLLKITSLNRPILIYIFICILATLFGAMAGDVQLKVAFFYFLKYLEYFLLFFMVTNSLRSIRQIKIFIFLMILVSLVVSMYAWKLHFLGVERVTAPFEGEVGEANTLGGYLVLMSMVIMGLLLNLPSLQVKILLSIVLIFVFFALLFTLSRGAWVGFLLAMAAFFSLTRKGKVILFFFGIITLIFSPMILPRYVHERIKTTFVRGKEYDILGKRLTLEESAAARIENWKIGLKKWSKRPILGYGISGGGQVVDNQYTRVLVETGLSGFIAFFWVMAEIFRSAMSCLAKFIEDRFFNGLIVGFIAGFVGLLVHAFGAATFIIIRIMEPFWFLTAIVLSLPEIIPSFQKEI